MFDESPVSRRQLAAAAAIGAMAVALPSSAEAKHRSTSAEAIKALFAAHNQAFTAQNMAGVLVTLDPKAIIMGTAPGELWVGTSEITDAYKHFFEGFDVGKQKFDNLWLDVHITGNTALLLAVSKVTMYKAGKEDQFGLNISVQCEQGAGGKWLIRAMHFSNLTGKA